VFSTRVAARIASAILHSRFVSMGTERCRLRSRTVTPSIRTARGAWTMRFLMMSLIRLDDLLDQPMVDDILFREVNEGDAGHLHENVPHIDQPGHTVRGQIARCNVSRD